MEAQKMKFDLDLDQVNMLLHALGKLSLEQSVGLFMYLKTAAESQLAAAQPQAEAVAVDGVES